MSRIEEIPTASSKAEWIAHKGPFIHVGDGVMKCPRCGLEGRGSMVFGQVSCIRNDERG